MVVMVSIVIMAKMIVMMVMRVIDSDTDYGGGDDAGAE